MVQHTTIRGAHEEEILMLIASVGVKDADGQPE